ALGGLAAGIVAAEVLGGATADRTPAALAAALLAAAGLLLRWRPLLVIGVTLAAMVIGVERGSTVTLPTGARSVAAMIGPEERELYGTAVDDPRPRGERQQVVIDGVERIGPEGEPTSLEGRVLLWLPRHVEVAAGDRLRLRSALEQPEDFEGFAYRAYLARQGIAAIASSRAASVVGNELGPVADALHGVRSWLLSGLNRLIPEPEAALAAGILLGVRSGIDPAINDAFARAGLTHVVAISGWNIAIVAALAGAASRPLTRLPSGRWLAAAAATSTVAAYVVLTGASPSVVRAALMAGALLVARLGGARSHAMSALMLAALLMMAVSPAIAWDVGFQLSALATAGLIWFGAAFAARLRRWPAIVREPVALTMAAQVTTLPVILLNFERLSLIAPLANVLVVPLVPLVMLGSALAALAGAAGDGLPLSGGLAWLAGGIGFCLLRAMVVVGQAAAAVPLASVELTSPPWLAAAWYPAVLLARRRLAAVVDSLPGPRDEVAMAGGLLARLARPVPLTIVALLLVGGLTLATRPDGRLHLFALDIGQGDAILVVAPTGETALIDGGPDPDLTLRRLGERLPFWQRRIELLVLTHPHEDHLAGLLPALERYAVGLVLEPGRAYDNPSYPRFLYLAAHEPGGRLRLGRAGDVIPLGPAARFRILYPSADDAAGPLPEDDINNASLVLLLESGRFRALLTGDAEAPVERRLLDRGLIGPADVLKVGHHGSESSTLPELLAHLRPSVALISCGAGNEYGHPHAITLEHLRAVPGLWIRRTDVEGTLEVVADGGGPAAAGGGAGVAGSIGPWVFPVATRPCSCSSRWISPTASWSIPGAWRGSRPKPRAWWRQPVSRSMCGWSRSPPCCMTSTSRRPALAAGCMARSPPIGWPPWATRS
ncbi:MAG TPA: DNA internalization-related competence protein ComEC/Rec2, partial [Candidatus Limnocylindria bacterium]|nr:DNA internalization-related competence protein ComEC/Rec2 [Candidatus Limnocylindria bacterium]